MSNKTKLIIAGLFIVQIGVIFWARYDKSNAHQAAIEEVIQAYLDNPSNKKLLSLSNMEISELPEMILECQSVENINLSHNNLEEIPPILFQLPNLKYLNLTYNKLKSVRFKENASIQYLDLGHNNIDSIGNQNALKKLSTLVLEDNYMDYCPNFDHDIYSLDLSRNNIRFFKSLNDGNSKITYLDLSDNQLNIGSNIGSLVKRCTLINLSGNFHGNIPFPEQLVSDSSTIKKLYLNDCKVSFTQSLPKNQLEILNISKVETVSNLDGFHQLKTLKLNGSRLQNLNYSNPNLEKLDLRNVKVYGSLNLDLPNLEILHLSESFDLVNYTQRFPNLKIIYYYGDLSFGFDLKQKYPDVQLIRKNDTD